MTQNRSGNEAKGRSFLSAAATKWMVVGVIAVAFMVIFQSQLGRLLDRVSDVEVSSSGIKIKTVDTPIGKAEVSVVPVRYSSPVRDGIQGTTFTSNQFKFQISWPNKNDWTGDEAWGPVFLQNMGFPPTVKAPIMITYNQVIGNTTPNVNVIVEKIGNMDIQSYLDLSNQGIVSVGGQVISSTVDEQTQGGFTVLKSTNAFGELVYQFQRTAIANGNAYIITATQIPPDNQFSQQMKNELNSIVNSFRIIE